MSYENDILDMEMTGDDDAVALIDAPTEDEYETPEEERARKIDELGESGRGEYILKDPVKFGGQELTRLDINFNVPGAILDKVTRDFRGRTKGSVTMPMMDTNFACMLALRCAKQPYELGDVISARDKTQLSLTAQNFFLA